VQQRADGELLAQARVEPEPGADGAHVVGDLLGMAAQERVLGLDRLRQHPDRRDVRDAQLVVQAHVVQHRAGVVAQGEQDVVVEVVEAALAVGADHDAAELVGDVDGDRDHRVLAHDRVALDDLLGEALGERVVLVDPLARGRHELVGGAVTVDVLAQQEQAALRLGERHRGVEDELLDVAPVAEVRALALELGDLAAQLAVGLALARVAPRPAARAVLGVVQVGPQLVALGDQLLDLLAAPPLGGVAGLPGGAQDPPALEPPRRERDRAAEHGSAEPPQRGLCFCDEWSL
jgi:hypothetical protein